MTSEQHCSASRRLTGTVHLSGNTVAIFGHNARTLTVEPPDDATTLPQQRANITTQPFTSALGDHTGLKFLLHSSGHLYVVPDSPGRSANHHETLAPHNPSGPLLSRLASTASGATAAIPLLAPAAQNFFVLTWPTIASFEAWHAAPSRAQHAPSSQTLLPGAPADLAASSTAFVLRTRAGDVYTWGDARHAAALGRAPTPEEPAGRPARVAELQLAGFGMARVAGARGGWAGGAVSGEGDAWVWGMDAPGVAEEGAWLEGGELGLGVAPAFWQVVGPDVRDGTEMAQAVALGASHALVVLADGHVLSSGCDSHGQLGLGHGVGPGHVREEIVERLGGVDAGDREGRQDFVRRELAGALGHGEVVKGWRQVVVEGAEGRAVDAVASEWASFIVFETDGEGGSN